MLKLRVSSLVLGMILCAALTSVLCAQNIAPSSAGGGGGGDDKKPAAKTDTKKTPATTEEQLAIIAEQMRKMQETIDAQQQKIDNLEKERSFAATGVVPRIGGDEYVGTKNIVAKPARDNDGMTLHIGDATITPVGFVDFTGVFRTRNTTNTFGTNFGQVPFDNTIQGHLSETRLGAMNSQIGFRVNARHGNSDITGYVEMDFLGNDAANVFVNGNSHTTRLRQMWVDFRHGKSEFAGGQMWSLLTPNRHGLGPDNDDVFFTNNIDRNYQVGLVFARQAGLRFIYHPNEHWSIGFAVENPQQYVGIGEVIFPFLYNAQLGPQFDAANNPGTPNLLPDIIAKAAWDRGGDHPMHIEFAGLLRTFKMTTIGITPNFVANTTEGFGGSVNALVGLTKKFRYVGNFFGSTGGGRYSGGLGPDLVVWADPSSIAHIRTVDTYATIQGFEADASPKLMLDAYYGASYSRHAYAIDPTNPVPGRFDGFGAPNSPNTSNRAVQEFTFGTTYTMWRDPKYGAFQWLTQSSYVTRAPWFVAPGAPVNAHTFMLFTSFRYVFPGRAPDAR
ncbi:MAG: hypothetical protein JO314_13240 [Acidobacteria bacterium]|nr:hypothetical protein [Acidobacteriota bacterium]